MELLRTPDEAFADVPGWDHEPTYVDVSTLDDDATPRVAVVDVGPRDAPPVLMLHGEPTWGFLYRHVVDRVVEAGLRAVVPDLVGFGRSDKPAEVADHTYARHVDWQRQVVEALDLTDVTLLCQDWGGLIGLRVLADQPDRFARVVAANTGLADGSRRMPDVWWSFHDFVERTPDLPVGSLVQGGAKTELADEVVAAYDAPFPDASYKAGARAMPGLIPQSEDDPAVPDQRRAWQVLQSWDKPFVCAFSDSDPITARGDRPFHKLVPGTQGEPHRTITAAGHFLQEDNPADLAQVVVDAVRRG